MGAGKTVPRPHQREAVAAAVVGLRRSSRGQIHMACGSGKTLVGLWTIEHFAPRTVVIFVPSLLLARQLLDVYRREWQHDRVDYLAVCSDVPAGSDETAVPFDELSCSVTTVARDVVTFFRRKTARLKVAVCTYQSAHLLGGLTVDFALFDEAHRTAGPQGKPFAFALLDKNVVCKRRLFMTATPRHVAITEAGESRPQYSMDDAAVYGPVLYTLSLRRAIDLNLVCDYTIIVSVARGTKKDSVAATRLALKKAMQRYGIRKVFTFHATVSAAKEFIATQEFGTKTRLFHVNGKQLTSARRDSLREFEQAELGVASNVRCLGEGVDLPATDMVAFISKRDSVTDIVQTVGRALRLRTGKSRGYIFLPLFVRQQSNESIDAALRRTGFKQVHDVIEALRNQDHALASLLKQKAEKQSATDLPATLVLDGGSARLNAALRKAVTVRILRPYRTRIEDMQRALLERARAGMPRPSLRRDANQAEQALCRYWRSLRHYPSKFNAELKALVPRWFDNGRQADYDELLERVTAGLPKPKHTRGNPHERHLWLALQRLRNSPRRRVFYDKICTINPAWDRTQKMRLRKERFLRLAREKRLHELSATERRQLSERRHEDRTFAAAWKRVNPAWRPRIQLPTIILDAKATLLRAAKAGERRPRQLAESSKERRLSRALVRLTSPKDRLYDEKFASAIRSYAPLWLRPTVSALRQKTQNILLTLARSGTHRSQLTFSLITSLHYYASEKSKHYDAIFVRKLKSVAPTWITPVMMSAVEDVQKRNK